MITIRKTNPIQMWRKSHTNVAEIPYKCGGNGEKYISMIYKAPKKSANKYLIRKKVKKLSFIYNNYISIYNMRMCENTTQLYS